MNDPTSHDDIIIFGASGHAKVVFDIARLNGLNVVAFAESEPRNPQFQGRPVHRADDVLRHRPCKLAIVAIGNPVHRQRLSNRVLAAGYTLASLFHPSAAVSEDVEIGDGTVVMANAVINPGSRIGVGGIINTGATVDHDCELGNYVHISPGASLGGTVHVGDGTFVGIGSTVIQGIKVGQWSLVGAGAVVVRDLPSDVVAYGVPATVRRYGRHFAEEAETERTAAPQGAPGGKPDLTRPVRILFTASGRRVSLLRFFRTSGKRLDVPVELHVADTDVMAPTWELADHTHQVPRSDAADFVSSIVDICRRCGIDLLIPLIDPELPIFARHRQQIEATGAKLVLSDLETVEIAADKLHTYEHFSSNGITTARTWAVEDEQLPAEAEFPLIMKPRCGSGSVHVEVINHLEEFKVFARRIPKPCVQPVMRGREYTFDVWVSPNGVPACIVPRLRIETRAGESSKGVTRLDARLIEAVRATLATLPGARGPLNIQAFWDGKGPVHMMEINPRFAGGYVLTYRAGADFPAALLLEHLGRDKTEVVLQPRSDIFLLRYDDELITDLATLRARGYKG